MATRRPRRRDFLKDLGGAAVVLPALGADAFLPAQAGRRILPVLASTWISLFKDTSLVSVIAVSELAYASMQVRAQSFRVLEMLTAMAVIYWLMGYPQAKLVDWIHRKYGVKE